jgi:hypothetical protein
MPTCTSIVHAFTFSVAVCDRSMVMASSGTLHSPNYPNPYPNDITCEVTIQVNIHGFHFVTSLCYSFMCMGGVPECVPGCKFFAAPLFHA